MAVSFSERQQQAINWDGNKELLVSAAAGSGKTTVLTARIIDRIVNKRIGIDEFLIVTYTHMAADDIKERITRALSERITQSPEDTFLSVQLAALGNASIGTMHSFCLKVLKEYHEHPAVMLPKNVRILSEEKGKELLQEAADEVFTDEYALGSLEFEQMLNVYASFRSDKEVREYAKSIYKFALNDEHPYEWLERMKNGGSLGECMVEMYSFVSVIAKEAIDICNECIEKYNDPKADKFSTMLKQVREKLEQYIEKIRNKEYDEADGVMQSIDFINLQGGGKNECVTAYKNVLTFIKESVVKRLRIESETCAGGSNMQGFVATLIELAIKIGKRFEEKKHRAKVIDYSDMEHMVLKLFDDESVAQLYSERYKHIMFDEYQDCNRLQESIVKKIAVNSKYFMVGDIKQSIYSFRQAEPQLFLDKYKEYRYDENAEYAKIELNENYRSRENVLNASNRIFFKIMTEKYCGMEYNEENALNGMATYPQNKELNTFESEPVKLALIRKKGRKTAPQSRAQLLYIIDSIKSMMRSKHVFDAKLGEYRPLRYSDIAILMRSPKSELFYIKEAFSHTEIPINILQDADIRYAPEVNLLICLIKIIENPYNDIELMSVLRSYIFGVTDSELARLACVAVDNGDNSLIAKLDAYENTPGCDEELCGKIQLFNRKYAEWTENSLAVSADDFIDGLLSDVAYYEYFSAQDDGLRRRENIDYLKGMLTQGSGAEGGGLYECVRVIRNIDENGLSAPNSLSAAESVSVMSMHKSKGLEFPVVFIMDMCKSFSVNDTKGMLLMHKDYGIVSQYIDRENRVKYKTRDYAILKYIMEKKRNEEEQRILYVAMTRAREHLVLIATGGDDVIEKGGIIRHSTAYISNAGCYRDWILYGLCCHSNQLQYSVTANDIAGGVRKLFAKGNELYPSEWKCTVYDITDNGLLDSSGSKAVGSNTLAPEVRENLQTETGESKWIDFERLMQKLEYTYPFAKQTKISSKLSVTQIKNILEQSDEEYIPDYRTENVKRISTGDSMSATRVGSLYHFFMQHATLRSPYGIKDFESDIERMLNKKLITENEAKRIDAGRILPFFNSEMGRRICSARACYREKNFSYLIPANQIFADFQTDDRILVQGVADCMICDKDGKFVLIDYKTDRIAPEDKAMLAQKHKKQLELYRQALEAIEGIAIEECYIFSFALGEFIHVERC